MPKPNMLLEHPDSALKKVLLITINLFNICFIVKKNLVTNATQIIANPLLL